MIRVFIIVLISVIYGSLLNAQLTIPSRIFVQNQLQNIDNNILLQIPNRTFKPALINEVEIRTETDEFQFDEQQYQLRITPNTNRIRKAERHLHQLYQKEANQNLSREKQEFIVVVYEDLLRGYELNRKLIVKEELLLILRDRERVTEQLSIKGQISPREWLRVQRQLSELTMEIEQHQYELGLLFSNQNLTWDEFVKIENIPDKLIELTQIRSSIDTNVEAELVAAEIEIEEAERNKILDFIQFEYNSSPEDFFREKLSIGAGFVLPFYGDRKLKLEELAIEEANIQAEIAVQKQQKDQDVQRLQRELTVKYKELDLLKNSAANLQKQVDSFIEKVNQSENSTPLLLLEERFNQSELTLEHLELEMDIYELYLEILEESGAMFLPSGIDYLFLP